MSKLFEEAVDAETRKFLLDDLRHSIVTSANIRAITGSDAVTTGSVRAMQDTTQELWLEKTQSMRVVALNEACAFAKVQIENGRSFEGDELLSLAAAFAKFLVDGKH